MESKEFWAIGISLVALVVSGWSLNLSLRSGREKRHLDIILRRNEILSQLRLALYAMEKTEIDMDGSVAGMEALLEDALRKGEIDRQRADKVRQDYNTVRREARELAKQAEAQIENVGGMNIGFADSSHEMRVRVEAVFASAEALMSSSGRMMERAGTLRANSESDINFVKGRKKRA